MTFRSDSALEELNSLRRAIPKAKDRVDARELMIQALLSFEREKVAFQKVSDLYAEVLRDYLDRYREFEFKNNRWYLGNRTKRKLAVTAEEVLETLLEKSGGDVTSIARCMAASFVKHGEVAEVFGEAVRDQLFATEVVQGVHKGPPRKK